ncbi:MAG TPA: hypothetical protein VLU43_15415 [Anaeromyxobacteraceae bacterium]|nr:hypothetical protein [Anaeromyxobacteraceae bacterium]
MIRPLEPRDLPAAVALAAVEGCRTDERWWRLWLGAGTGLCIDSPGGGLAALAVVCGLGEGGAGLPAFLVARAHVRRGLGRRLADAAAALHPGVPLQVHAPAATAPAFERLGFSQVGEVVRHAGVPGARSPQAGEARLRPLAVADFASVVAIDEAATGGSRRTLLERLFPIAERACVAATSGRIAGYGIAWPLAGAVAVGPVIGESAGISAAIAGFLAAGHATPVHVWTPAHGGLSGWAGGAGLRPAGSAVCLVRGGPLPRARPGWLHALAAPGAG